jgi:hypothetical protein
MAAEWKPVKLNDDEKGVFVEGVCEFTECEDLVTESGEVIAFVIDYDYACYPHADPQSGEWKRGGSFSDRAAAFLWCERVAGLHPLKPGDISPANNSVARGG